MSVEKCQSHLWTETPLIFSSHLSTRLGRDEYAVYLKLEVRAAPATRISSTAAVTSARTSSRHIPSSTAASRSLYSARSRHTGQRCASYVRRGAMQGLQLHVPRRYSAYPAPSTSRTASTRARKLSCATPARRSSSSADSISRRSERPRWPYGHSPTRTWQLETSSIIVRAFPTSFRQCARARVRPSHAMGGPRVDDRRDTNTAPVRRQACSGVLQRRRRRAPRRRD
jgi:hypothetical protein